MYRYAVQTLVDITENGDLKKEFPFKTKSNELVHDRHSLEIARNQNNNFTSLIQLLQVRSNIVWEHPPMRSETVLNQNKIFGTAYEGKASMWTFIWETEQPDIYSDMQTPTGTLAMDFENVPVLIFCKESVTFPASAFLTQDHRYKNTQFTYLGMSDK